MGFGACERIPCLNQVFGFTVPQNAGGLTAASTDDVSALMWQVGGSERRYHVVITAQGSAVHWQARVHYYWYTKVRAQCEEELGVDCQMGGFTRILHSGQPDELMDEIPTHVVQPLQDRDNKGSVSALSFFLFCLNLEEVVSTSEGVW